MTSWHMYYKLFLYFWFFFTSACICKLKTVPELWKVYDLNLYNLFYQILWLLVALFICSYYGKEADTLASLRHARFMGSVTISLTLRPQNLPPSERAIHFHALRVHSQVCGWSNLDLECLSPLDWGWYQMKDTLEQIKLILKQHLLICQISSGVIVKHHQKNTCGSRLHVFMLSEWNEMCSSLRWLSGRIL